MKNNFFFLIKIFLLILLFYNHQSTSYGYNFENFQIDFVQKLKQTKEDINSMRLAVVFISENHETLKNQTNLVQFKKEFSYNLLKFFKITDPIIVNKIIRINKLDPKTIKNNPKLIKSFLERAGGTHLLYIYIIPNNGSTLEVKAELINSDTQSLVITQQYIKSEPLELAPLQATNPRRTTSPYPLSSSPSSSSSALLSTASPTPLSSPFANNYNPPVFNLYHNNSWMFFSPTALLIPYHSAVNLQILVNDTSDTDISMRYLRYDLRYNVLQLDLESIGRNDGIHHSSYARLRFHVINEENFPLNISIGIRNRLFWNQDNIDFVNEDKDLEDINYNRNRLTLFTSLTHKVQSLGLLYNIYIDNQTASVGAKLLLSENIKFFAENLYNYYEGASIVNDFAVGLEIAAYANSLIISYQDKAECALLGVQFGW